MRGISKLSSNCLSKGNLSLVLEILIYSQHKRQWEHELLSSQNTTMDSNYITFPLPLHFPSITYSRLPNLLSLLPLHHTAMPSVS